MLKTTVERGREALLQDIALYINRDCDADRCRSIEEQLEALGMGGERIRAVEKNNLPPELIPYFAHRVLNKPPLMSPSEIGCYGSHLLTWMKIVADNRPVTLVLEDDAELEADLETVLPELIATLPQGWDFVQLSRKPDRAYRELASLAGGRKLVRYSRIPANTAGYLISRQGAEKMLKAIPRIWPVDCDTRRPWVFDVDAYGVVPPPIGQNKSAFGTVMTGKSRLRRGLPRITAYSWSSNPMRSPASLAFNIRKLGLGWWLRCVFQNAGIRVGKWLHIR